MFINSRIGYNSVIFRDIPPYSGIPGFHNVPYLCPIMCPTILFYSVHNLKILLIEGSDIAQIGLTMVIHISGLEVS
jgi:hypothetical protein